MDGINGINYGMSSTKVNLILLYAKQCHGKECPTLSSANIYAISYCSSNAMFPHMISRPKDLPSHTKKYFPCSHPYNPALLTVSAFPVITY